MTPPPPTTEITWPILPALCPVCQVGSPYPDDSQGHLSKRYRCGQLLWLIGEQWELAIDEDCRHASRLVIEQRQRADALAAQVAALRRALEGAREYLRHSEGCSYPFNELYGCRCGFLETLAEIDAALAAAPEGVTK